MSDIKKGAMVAKQVLSDEELTAINAHAMRELSADEVFTFKLAACNNQVDRDIERFTDKCLDQLAKLFVGKPVLMDHLWSAEKQTARIYAASVESMPGVDEGRQLILRCYMLRSEGAQSVIDALEAGILKECSVGCAVAKATCSICGSDYQTGCDHRRGYTYDGKTCHVMLSEAVDAYEVSLVAVPAQPAAGVVKGKKAVQEPWTKQARQMLDLETVRYGALRR